MCYKTGHFTDRARRHALVITALSLNLLSLTCLLFVLASGFRAPVGKLGGHSFAVVIKTAVLSNNISADGYQIDSSKVEVKTSGHTFRGLPDANDHSKHKDFYAFYLWNYCSGMKVNNTSYVDFCSEPEHSLYDLFRYWKLWGADFHNGIQSQFQWLEQGPRLLYIPYLVTGGLAVLAGVAGIPPLANDKISRSVFILSMLASASFLTTAIMAQTMYSQLIRRANEDDVPITVQKVGQTLYVANWVGWAVSFITLTLWYYLMRGNTVDRAPTIDAVGYPRVQMILTDTPVFDQPFVESPVRKRNFAAVF